MPLAIGGIGLVVGVAVPGLTGGLGFAIGLALGFAIVLVTFFVELTVAGPQVGRSGTEAKIGRNSSSSAE